MAAALTLGVEEELHIVDLATSQLAARAPALLARLPEDGYSAELQRTTIETNTDVCSTLDELREDIVRLRSRAVSVAEDLGLGLAAVGTAPLSSAGDFELTSSGRFARMQEDYRLLVDEQLICGTQVHVGLPGRDLAVAVAQRVSRDLPLLVALSASSPFWHGADTGYASIRTIIWQRWPTSGTTGPISSAAEYDDLLADLISSGVISDTKMAYFDVRPSAHVPTIELRVCDAIPLVDDTVLIAGLFRAMVGAAAESIAAGRPHVPVTPPLHRAAMWRAARSGLSGNLLDNSPRPQPVPAEDAIRALADRLRPQLEEVGDYETVADLLDATLARGNSADRQRGVYAQRGRMADVVALAVEETHGSPAGPPAPTYAAPSGGYPAAHGDEAFTPSGQPRAPYLDLLAVVEKVDPAALEARIAERDEWESHTGLTFGVNGEQRPFPVDLMPRLVPAHEWARLSAGLTQRARALEAFLQDIYGPADLLRDGVVPAETVYRSPGWRDEARRLPAGVVRAPVIGFDLVRDDVGGWRVLEDNARVPSGVGYSIAIRRLMDAVMPDLPRPPGLLDPQTAPPLLGATLRACAAPSAPGEPVVALLSDGADNSAWFEHRLLANDAGLLLAQVADLDVVDGVVRVGGKPVDGLYLRLDVELAQLLGPDGRAIGAELLDAAAAGRVTLANAPGNGVADDKAMYCHVPDLIAYYLGERPLLDPVPTYRCADPEECTAVLERLEHLVTKPVDGYGGGGVLIGPHASADELAARRAEILANPSRWVAQETVSLSSHPTFAGDGLAPRHVDLRAFVYLTGTGEGDARLADVALTRVAPAGSMVVNSSRGGGAKDTWIIGATADE